MRWLWPLVVLLQPACSHSVDEQSAPLRQVVSVWRDTFGDDTQVAVTTHTRRVTDVTADEGSTFVPFAGNPLLTVESCDPWDAQGDVTRRVPGAVHPDVQYFPEGKDGFKYWMIFTPMGLMPEGAPSPPDPGTARDWWWERNTLVRSNDGIHWVKTSDYENPLVVPGPEAWDASWHADPDFIYAPGKGPNGESWFLYWTGCGEGTCRVVVAISSDGKHYSKVGPIMPGWTRTPTALYDAESGLFHLWYNWGTSEVAYATSRDGIHWTPYDPVHPDNPLWGYVVLGPEEGAYDQGGISHIDVIRLGSEFHMYYLAQPTPKYAGMSTGHAVSTDGIHWRRSSNLAITPGDQVWRFTDGESYALQTLYRASAVVVDGTVQLYYCGSDSYSAYPEANHWEIGLAYALPAVRDGHMELGRHHEPAPYYPRPGTLAWYHFDEGVLSEPPPSPHPGEYTAQDGTLAWYHFNEADGAACADVGGALENNGALQGAVFTGGLYGNALSFNGAARVTVPDSPELAARTEITIEAWVQPAAHQSNDYIAVKMTPRSGDAAYGLKLENFYTGTNEIGAFIADTSGRLYFAYGGSVSPGTWTHVAMTYRTGDSHIRLYQDGVEVAYRYGEPGKATDIIPAGTELRSNLGPLNVGVLPFDSPLYYRGLIDELRILGRALPPEQVAADGGGVVTSSGVQDASGNGNHGTPSGAVSWLPGRFTYGVTFDGTGSIVVPYTSNLDATERLTLEAWVHPALDKPNNYVAIRMTPGNTDSVYGLKLESTYTGHSEIGGWITGTNGLTYFSYGGHVPVGTWTHVAMVYETHPTEPTRIRLYQDGSEVTYRFNATVNNGTDMVPAGTLIRTNHAPLVIGKISYGSNVSSVYEGLIDELRIVAGDSAPTEAQLLTDAGQRYWPTGQVTSTVLVPASGDRWLRFETLDHRPTGTRIIYSILDENGELLLYPVQPGSDISSLGSTPIQLHAELATDDPAATPMVFEWSLQTERDTGLEPGVVPLAAAALLGPGRLLLGFVIVGFLAGFVVRRRSG